MSLFEICIRRPCWPACCRCCAGDRPVSTRAWRCASYPKIDEPVVSVSTSLPGASAEVIESQITKVLEDSLAGIEGVELMTSSSRSERSNINVRFRITRDPDSAAADVRDKGGAGAGAPAGRGRRAGDRQGRGRRLPDHLDGGHAGARTPIEVSDYLAATSSRACRCCPARPTCGSSASGGRRCASTSTRPVGRLPADGAGRRGRAAAGQRRAAVGPHRVGAARVHHRRATDLQTVQQFEDAIIAKRRRLSGAPARRRHGGGRRAERARDRPLQRRAVDQHGRGQAGHRQPARAVEGGARRVARINETLPPG